MNYGIVLVSGGFDPIHEGHIELLRAASKYGPVWVALNSTDWLIRKKGFAFHPNWHARRRIVEAIRDVSQVVMVEDGDGTVCSALRKVQPKYFANGGDRENPEPREHALCKELGIVELFNVGGGKIQSSSALIQSARAHNAHPVSR